MRRFVPALFLTLAAPAAASIAAASPANAALGGVVRDSVTGQPVAGVRLGLSWATTTSSQDGSFSLATRAWPATLVASREGYRVSRLELAAAPAGPLEVRLEPVVSYSDRIEVTATRAREGVDPATFTNIPEEKLRQEHYGQDPAILLSQLTPGFMAYNDSGNGIGYSYFTVRGFGQARSRVTLNGAPLNDAESGELFFIDLADFLTTAGDVQLGRGVFGLSGIGGSLDITTTPSASGPSFTLQGGIGSFGSSRTVARFDSGLLGGAWAVTARYSRIRTDGYRDQSWVEMWNGFLSVSRFGTRSRLRFVAFGGPEETHLAYNGVPKSTLDGGLTGDADQDRRFNPITWPGEIDHFFQPHFQLLHDLDLGHSTKLSQTFYAFRGDGYYEQYRQDRTLAEYNLPDVTLPDGTVVAESDLVRRRDVGEWDFGWVPTLTQVRGPFTLNLSGELRQHSARHLGTVEWAEFYAPGVPANQPYYDYRVDKQTATGLARVAWNVSPKLTLSAGLALTHERYEMSEDQLEGVAFDETYDFVLPRFGAVLHLAKDADVYFNVARGGRAPAFRQLYDPEDYYGVRAELDPEDVTDYEAGVSLRRGAWYGRLNLFFMDFRNEIVYAGALDDNGVPIYGNGARSHHTGLEAEGSWSHSKRLALDGHLSLARNTFTEYSEYGWDGSVVSHDGNRIAGFPDVMASLSARTSFGPVTLSLTGRHVGRFYLDNTEDLKNDPAARLEPGYVPRVNPSYTVVDAVLRADLPRSVTKPIGSPRLGFELRASNLFDQRYTAFGYLDGEPQFIPASTRNLYAGVSIGF
jgi:iron complex outermembrane recepter protein